MRFDSLHKWLAWQESFHPRSIDLGLSRVRSVHLGMETSTKKPLTITVAGTNGKGSCIAFLSAILRAEGYHVGAYTSPHLLRYNERIQIDGEPVDDARICAAFERVDQARGGTSLTYFEFGTLAALDLFVRSDVDVQLLEVGLGGRLDAVNIIDADAMLVTCIEIDHVDWLGESREAIGLEKAGVFRPGVGAVVGEIDPPESIPRYAEEHNIPLSRFGREFDYQVTGSGWTWISGDKTLRHLPVPALPGEHQFQNASSVLQALKLIESRCPVSRQAVCKGLESVSLPGRFQYISGTPSVLLDVAHNPQAAGTLARYIEKNFHRRRIVAVFSIMGDKDIRGVIENVRSLVSHWIFAPLSTPRCASEKEIAGVFSACGIAGITLGRSCAEAAFEEAARITSGNDLVVVFGSFFLVAEFLRN
ncbi:MAG: bifunctional tetrahydrofolate synthase/dihydrofolate synthase, partial [Methylococcaceae bacterium]|nr:bifunctional tetrahydrofolate synthase/dihydrofolate synthase [Methylococcaceae bacterium]